MIYSWKMFKKTSTEEEYTKDDTETLRTFAATNITKDQNLVINAKALSAGTCIIIYRRIRTL